MLGGVIIDKNYAREIIVMMTSSTEQFRVKKRQKIAQLIISNKKTEKNG